MRLPIAPLVAAAVAFPWLAASPSAGSTPFPAPTNNQDVAAQPLTNAADRVSRMKLPPGFKATLFAAEPDVQNPIAMCWDERGRLWIAENYTYSDNKERFDLKLRDRILILEDTDNDGRFDRRTVFAEDLQMLTSIERGFGGVYAMCPPHLLWIPTDGDKPSGPPQILVDGFSTTAASRHTFANGLKWGPDGWLYGRVGISSTSWAGVPGTPQAQRQPTAGGIWRYHPVRKLYEPYCHGTTNPWGMDWDRHGEMFFINTVIGHLWHGIQGAHYKRMHGDDPYPQIYDLIDQHADHYHWDSSEQWTDVRQLGVTAGSSRAGGGHAHVGLLLYQGDNFPPEYRGKLFTTNLHGRRVNVDRLERRGSGYVGRHEPDFMLTDDPWFRGIEIQAGPDGGVYILDWSDIGECHDNDGVHRTSGRIYKLTYGDARRPAEADLTRLPDTALVALQRNENEWLVRMARWELRERARVRGGLPELAPTLVHTFQSATATRVKLNAWWTLQQTAEFAPPDSRPHREADAQLLRAMLGSKDEHLHRWVTPQAIGTGHPSLEESSALVRLARASALPSLPVLARTALAARLLAHGEDADDHNLPLMYWAGVRELAPDELVRLFPSCRIPLVRRLIARRVSEDLDTQAGPLATLLGASTGNDAADVVRGMSEALKGRSKARKPAGWEAFSARAIALVDASVQPLLRDLDVLFGSGRALAEIRALALDGKAPTDQRRAALRTLIEARPPELRKICESMVNLPGLSLTAIQGLGTFDDPAAANRIIARYRSLTPQERPAALAVLVSRPAFTRVLLDHVENPTKPASIARQDISPALARQMRSFNDPQITQKLAEVWGEARESSADKQALATTLTAKLTPAFIARGQPGRGRALFAAVCAGCHTLYGEGHAIGPDLTGSGRREVSYLIENLADPNAVVAADYLLHVITLKDGRVLNGMIATRNVRTVTVRNVGQDTVVDRAEIARDDQLAASLMPEGLLNALNDEQLADLIAYLMSERQVPLP